MEVPTILGSPHFGNLPLRVDGSSCPSQNLPSTRLKRTHIETTMVSKGPSWGLLVSFGEGSGLAGNAGMGWRLLSWAF